MYSESNLNPDHLVPHGPFFVDFENRLVKKQDGSIEHLSPLEMTVLMRLTENFLSQKELAQRVSGLTGLQTSVFGGRFGTIEDERDFVLDPNTVTPLHFTEEHLRTVIKTLREKLGPAIENKFGRGYRLASQ